MTIPNQAQLISNLSAAVVNKAILEPAFRAQLLSDPKAAVEKALNTQLPPGIKLKVVEASPTEYTVVLPYEAKTSADGELSDVDLESVAGGSKSGAKNFFHDLNNTIQVGFGDNSVSLIFNGMHGNYS